MEIAFLNWISLPTSVINGKGYEHLQNQKQNTKNKASKKPNQTKTEKSKPKTVKTVKIEPKLMAKNFWFLALLFLSTYCCYSCVRQAYLEGIP